MSNKCFGCGGDSTFAGANGGSWCSKVCRNKYLQLSGFWSPEDITAIEQFNEFCVLNRISGEVRDFGSSYDKGVRFAACCNWLKGGWVVASRSSTVAQATAVAMKSFKNNEPRNWPPSRMADEFRCKKTLNNSQCVVELGHKGLCTDGKREWGINEETRNVAKALPGRYAYHYKTDDYEQTVTFQTVDELNQYLANQYLINLGQYNCSSSSSSRSRS